MSAKLKGAWLLFALITGSVIVAIIIAIGLVWSGMV